MMAKRSSVMKVLILLTIFLLAVIYAKDATTLEYKDFITSTESYTRLRIYKESEKEGKTRGPMSSSTEVSIAETLSSKAKREQVLRNILAARRRRMSKQRGARPVVTTPKELPDILEAQETKHAAYTSVAFTKNGTDTEKEAWEENLTTLTSEREDTESTMTMVPVTIVPKSQEGDNIRKKNTVSMSESLYKHFRPVESNIPMEDMSQFLYFGQKIQPELQNVTTASNESTEVATMTPGNLRRRTTTKKPITTTSVASSITSTTSTTFRPVEIPNEESNIALERRMIEKNKVSKAKSAMRDASSSYYRKTRLSDSTIATNVIPSKDIAHNENSTDVEGQVEERSINESLRKTKASRSSFRRSKMMENPGEKLENRSKEDKNSRESNSIDESTPSTTTLRIIVTEPEIVSPIVDTSTEMSTTTTTTTTTTSTTTQETRRHHQHHVYAYTITNVTRLLRNYSVAGSSGGREREREKERERGRERERERGRGGGPRKSNSSSSEITNGKVESPSTEASADTGVGGAGAGGAGAGGAGSAGAAAAATTADVVSLSVSVEPSRSGGGLSTGRNVEAVGGPSTIATSSVVGERRRKVLASGTHRAAAVAAVAQSAQSVPQRAPVRITSAVTRNRQWPERVAVTLIDGSTTEGTFFLRKPSASALLDPALTSKDRDNPEPFRMPSTGTRDSVLLDADRRNSLQVERQEDELRAENEASLKVAKNENSKPRDVPEGTTTLVDLAPLPSSSTESSTMEYITESSTENLLSSDTKDEARKMNDNNEQRPTETTTIVTTVTTVTAVPTTTTIETIETTARPAVFPVTPKLLVETSSSNRTSTKETPTPSSTESPNRPTPSKRPDQDRPFGIAADLDPSEIQAMYRSNASSTENTVPSASSTTLPPIRSAPENRGRSLSDKANQEDDVLPIMQLYNTSDIFDDGSTLGPVTRTVELPLEETDESKDRQEVHSEIPTTTVPSSSSRPTVKPTPKSTPRSTPRPAGTTSTFVNSTNRTRYKSVHPNRSVIPDYTGSGYQPIEFNRTFLDDNMIAANPPDSVNISEVILKRHDGDAIASQETVAVVSYILATLVVFPIAVGVGLILRRLIIRNRKVLEESDTSSEISCRKDALNLENGDFKTSIEKAITKLPRIQHLCHEAEKPPPPPSQESRWEFPRDKLRLQTVLGQGNFGQVWKAEADDLTGHQGTTRLVAVKTVKEGASEREKEDLVRELEIMQQLGSHPNVVTLLGCCTEEEPHYLILEYVMYGKLLAYLRDHRTRQDFYNFSEDSAALTSRDLTVFGYCVARGMEYLASKKIIHRDLAARNVLVDHNKLCKIADFGMSRFANEDGEVIETRHGRNALPIRWMAPESLIYSLFTTKTDVWSFGILMWEIVTLGSTPYPDMTAREVMRNVQSGYRLERPSHCRSELFRVISRCWHADPDRRPEFQILRRDLAQLLEDNMNGHYVDLESFASECTD